ncbi:hypothetical protein Q0601_02245 [Paracoccus onubensis]|uniref:hypothetical protein n=1 Tax=Paracoccus onubensis TaxID=1675788 RepID=UPI002730F8B2|nr:hypothetical protein [Paracoccus onubensis]MDP0925983.1 hypothetical protein [Paracoccus onubensis]
MTQADRAIIEDHFRSRFGVLITVSLSDIKGTYRQDPQKLTACGLVNFLPLNAQETGKMPFFAFIDRGSKGKKGSLKLIIVGKNGTKLASDLRDGCKKTGAAPD